MERRNGKIIPHETDMIKLTKTERAVMVRIIQGDRIFTTSPDARAVHKLAERGWIEYQVKTAMVSSRKAYEFGRRWTYSTEPDTAVIVTAPKIEAAIAKHGTETLLRSLHTT